MAHWIAVFGAGKFQPDALSETTFQVSAFQSDPCHRWCLRSIHPAETARAPAGLEPLSPGRTKPTAEGVHEHEVCASCQSALSCHAICSSAVATRVSISSTLQFASLAGAKCTASPWSRRCVRSHRRTLSTAMSACKTWLCNICVP
jgi:hypothetical protein